MGNTSSSSSLSPSPSSSSSLSSSKLDESTFTNYTNTNDDIHLLFQSLRQDAIDLSLPSNRRSTDIQGNLIPIRAEGNDERLLMVLNIPSYNDKGISYRHHDFLYHMYYYLILIL